MEELRPAEELRRHYELEKRLASALRMAKSQSERLKLYPKLYDELYREVPYLKTNPTTMDRVQLGATERLLKRFLHKDKVFLEIGAGNLALSRRLAPKLKQVFSLDVSKEFAMALGPLPKNISLILSDGISVPLGANTVDFAYSNQLMEHLHPEDAKAQLKNILRVLKPGGVYICNTPHRYNGPHDISQYFDQTATGFHLKEYTNAELASIMRQAGFGTIWSLTGVRGYVLPLPLFIVVAHERLFARIPAKNRRYLANIQPFKALLGIRLVAKKP
ncbi:MAG TPA: class I SAM-dependent methyltransferase [Verrucomicrobiae bacterium]|nr:class I SAM-dependent methyltransferase [Verrucomicrobiae bacterium]